MRKQVKPTREIKSNKTKGRKKQVRTSDSEGQKSTKDFLKNLEEEVNSYEYELQISQYKKIKGTHSALAYFQVSMCLIQFIDKNIQHQIRVFSNPTLHKIYEKFMAGMAAIFFQNIKERQQMVGQWQNVRVKKNPKNQKQIINGYLYQQSIIEVQQDYQRKKNFRAIAQKQGFFQDKISIVNSIRQNAPLTDQSTVDKLFVNAIVEKERKLKEQDEKQFQYSRHQGLKLFTQLKRISENMSVRKEVERTIKVERSIENKERISAEFGSSIGLFFSLSDYDWNK